ncbi:hypothetical protein [Paenibacillus validus]|uniref:hypothetical protein n=1 Tax=Paenibacillus validus TaxID=44253 RepID=UPI003D2A6861
MKKLTILLSALLIGTSLLAFGPAPETVSVHARQDELPAAALKQAVGARTLPTGVPAPELREAVNRFISQLAEQPGFDTWPQAEWTSQPLGPGTHGWIILVRSGGQEIGYLVVHADESGQYLLTEYGKGSFPLFSANTLYQSLVRLELIDYPYHAERLYWNPLQAVWKVSVENADRIWYLDAKTGEELPIAESDLPSPGENMSSSTMKTFTKLDSSHTIIETGETTPHDPYGTLPWVRGEQAADGSFPRVRERIEAGQPPVFAAELYNGSVTVPLAVAGYQLWSGGDSFVQVAQDGDRFIPLDALARLGRFYP